MNLNDFMKIIGTSDKVVIYENKTIQNKPFIYKLVTTDMSEYFNAENAPNREAFGNYEITHITNLIDTDGISKLSVTIMK